MNDMAKVIAPGTVRLERLLPGPIERLWAYLVEPDKRAQWFAGGPVELKAGGKVALHFQHSRLTVETPPARFKGEAEGFTLPGTVTRCEPPRLLAFSWGEGEQASEVTFELSVRGSEVLLVVTHARIPGRGQMVDIGSGWHLHLMLLGDLLSGRELTRFWATHAELERRYEEALPRA